MKEPTVIALGTGSSVARALGGDEPAQIKHPIKLPPTLTGKHGQAWLADLARGRAKLGFREDQDATLAHWVVEATWAHPAWAHYSLLLTHLRPLKGNTTPTRFYIDGATHELWVYVLNPEFDATETAASSTHAHWLQPMNFAAQFIEIEDALAIERVRNAAQMICDGKLSPDTDYQGQWVALFNNSMIKREYR